MARNQGKNQSHSSFDLTRRKLLATTGAAVAGVSAGCTGGDGNAGSSPGGNSTSTSASPEVPVDITSWPPENLENEMALWNWYDDWADWAIDDFEGSYDVSITHSAYATASEWYASLQAGNTNMDNIAAATNWVDRSVENDLLYELPVDQMPAWENVIEAGKQFSSYREDDRVYGVPETLVVYPLTYSTEEFGESGPDSWDVLWDDQYEGQLTMWDHSTVAPQIGALYTGQDPMNPDDYEEIKEALINQKPLNRTYWTDYQQGMSLFTNDDVVAGPLTMGRTYAARQEGASAHYTIPEEGSILTADMLVVPKIANNPMISTVFTNWATQQEHAAQMFKTMGYKPAVDISEYISEEEADFISWPDSAEFHPQVPLSEEVRSNYDRLWTEVKAA